MSKVLVPLMVVATLGLSAAAWQTYELSSQRARAMSLESEMRVAAANAAKLEKEAAQLRELNNIYQQESDQLRKKLADRSAGKADSGPSADPVEPATGADGQPEKPGAGKDGKGFMQTMAKMLKDPAMKQAIRGQQAMGMRMMYGDLAKEIGLSPDEANTIMEMLTDRQLEMSSKGMEMLGGEGGLDAEKLAESGKAANQTREEFDKQISDVLGQDRFKKFQDYEKTIGERVALSQIQQQMSSRGLSLEDGQRQQLLGIMVEERTNAPASPFDPANKDVAGQMKAMQSEEAINKIIDQQKQVNARVLTRAASLLSPDQVNALRESQDQFLEMQQFGIKMGRQMFNK